VLRGATREIRSQGACVVAVACVAEAVRCDKQLDILLVERGAGSTGVDCPSITWSVGLGVGCYPAVVHILVVGFPLLECGPTGPLRQGCKTKTILTNRHQQETRSGAEERLVPEVTSADALVSTEQHGQCVARMGGVCRRR
jgi:hypothetical protein